ncbi:MAG: MarR family winged helix-turn-helix transcriptional regulator [Pseudonocardiaceae bacterium]
MNTSRGLGTALGVAVVTPCLHVADAWGSPATGSRLAVAALAVFALGATMTAAATVAAAPAQNKDNMTVPAPPQPASTAASPSRDEVALADVIARLRRAMRRAARASDPDNALSVAQLELLSCLAENPGARPSQLARLLRLAPNSVSTLVNGLQTRNLITRSGSTSDRRTISLTLTDAGDHAVQHWHATNIAILRTALAELHPAWQHHQRQHLPHGEGAVGQLIWP